MSPYPFSDRNLAQPLEGAEGSANRAFVESRARLEPHTGATWLEVTGAYRPVELTSVMFKPIEIEQERLPASSAIAIEIVDAERRISGAKLAAAG